MLANLLGCCFWYQERCSKIWQYLGDLSEDGTGVSTASEVSGFQSDNKFLAMLDIIIYVIGIPFLLFRMWREAHLTRLDLDPNEDQVITFEEGQCPIPGYLPSWFWSEKRLSRLNDCRVA